MLQVGQIIYYLAPDALIHECEVKDVNENEVSLQCVRGVFNTKTSVHDSKIFVSYAEVERYLNI